MGKRKCIKKHTLPLLSVLCTLLGLFSASAASFFSPSALETSYAQLTAAKCKESKSNNANALFNIGESSYKEIKNTFSSLWQQNFLGTMQFIPACVNDDATDYASFPATLEGTDVSDDVAVGTAFLFSNQEKTMRFETLCINVYQKKWAYSSFANLSKDGFVFIPDYYADNLISRSTKMSSYDDLLPDYSENGTISNFQCLNIPFENSIRSWAIVGIYHAKGFNEAHYGKAFTSNDQGYGAFANGFNAPLLIGFDADFLTKNLNGFFVSSRAQTYVLKNNVETLISQDETAAGCARFFSLDSEKMAEIPSSYEIYRQCLLKRQGPSWQTILFVSLSLVFFACAVIVSKKANFKSATAAAFWLLTPTVVVGVVSGILRGFFSNEILFIALGVSHYLGLALLLSLLIETTFIVFYAKKEREGA